MNRNQIKAWESKRSGIVSQVFAEADGTFTTWWAGIRIGTSITLADAIRNVMRKTPAWDLTQLTVRDEN